MEASLPSYGVYGKLINRPTHKRESLYIFTQVYVCCTEPYQPGNDCWNRGFDRYI